MTGNEPAGQGLQDKTVPGLQARTDAADRLSGVLDSGQSLDAQAGLHGDTDRQPADRALTHAMVMAALRNLPTLDQAIGSCLKTPLPSKAARVQAILRIMAAQVLILDMPSHAAVSLAVEDATRQARTRPFGKLINAVGRRITKEKDTLLAARPPSDIPAWLQDRWTTAYGSKAFSAIAGIMVHQPHIDLSLHAMDEREALIEALTPWSATLLGPRAIRLTQPGTVRQLPGYENGQWWVQDHAASLPARWLVHALGDQREATVLDLCAAPGGKTAQLAAHGCQVTAVDRSSKRMERLKTNLQRLGLFAHCVQGDALSVTLDGPFDAVLVDAPCSATGTLRRNPDIGYLRTARDIQKMADLQERLLDRAKRLVKPGGVLVYATCSMEPEEGEQQLDRFASNSPSWLPVEPPADIVPHGAPQGRNWFRTLPHLSPRLRPETPGMDGFFVAAFRAPSQA